MTDFFMLSGYATIVVACTVIAANLYRAIKENHLREGFRPLLSSWFFLAVGNILHYSLLAAYRVDYLYFPLAAPVLSSPLAAFSTWVQAVGWVWLASALSKDYSGSFRK